MPDTTILLNGFSIIGDPQTNTNASAGGNLFVHGGTAVFDGNAIVVIEATNTTASGGLSEDSVITGITVYANATDYYYETPQYTYSGSAGLGSGRNTQGDRYLQFDAGTLTSNDAGAPVLGELAMVAGVDILSALDGVNGPYRVPTNEDIDLDGDGVISPEEVADGVFDSKLNELLAICFAKGTLIETPRGPRYIESLAIGDAVNTLDAGPQEIRWIGSRKIAGTGANAPVHIAAGALGNIRPLVVSQNHRMLVTGPKAELLFGQREVLVAAKHLVDDHKIRIVPCAAVEYFHFLCDAHQIVFAEGCPAESLFPGKEALNAVDPAARKEITQLFPDLQRRETTLSLSRYTLSRREAAALTEVA
ncbi:Hint domain-containing protein [Sulfitobacter sp. HNIBRBA3233]|uniref:Hint domain-containing protein n=1 Tax=Sulfitobacter marinivivus TaxID=3158558 RepID=UPI0032DF2167